MNDLNLLDRLPQASQRSRREVLGYWLLLSIAAAGLVSCLAVWPALRTFRSGPVTLLPCFLMGIFLATPFLPGIFFSLLDAPFGVRAAGVACATLLFIAATWLGFLLSGMGQQSLNEIGRYFGPAVPAGIGCVVLPFILIRHVFGWQIIMENWNTTAERQHVSVAGMMIATAYIGGCVAMLRASPSPLFAAAICACIAGAGFVLWTPYIYLTIRTRKYWVHYALFCVLGAVVGLAYGIATTFFRGESIRVGTLFSAAVVFGAGVSWLGLGLIAVRLLRGELVLNNDIGG